ncbi:MAG: hypothetical protein ACR2OZ_05650 [Verrucomicrobiales bacterium]
MFQPTTLANARLFYVARPADADGDVDKHIEAAIAMHGKRVSGGPAVAAPSSAHIRVDYSDRWHWDIVMYLRSLDVWFRDSATGQLIATGRFKQQFPHSFPDPPKKCREVIDSIFSAAYN